MSSHKHTHTHTHTQIYWAFKCLGISWQTLVCFLLRKWECNFLISHWDSEHIFLLCSFIFKYTLRYFEFSDFLCHAHSMQWYDWIVNENVFVVFSTTKRKKNRKFLQRRNKCAPEFCGDHFWQINCIFFVTKE